MKTMLFFAADEHTYSVILSGNGYISAGTSTYWGVREADKSDDSVTAAEKISGYPVRLTAFGTRRLGDLINGTFEEAAYWAGNGWRCWRIGGKSEASIGKPLVWTDHDPGSSLV